MCAHGISVFYIYYLYFTQLILTILSYRFLKSDSNFFPGLNAVHSRAQSESSGEFSLSLENEPWSNGSSPVQKPPSHNSSTLQPPSDASTPQRQIKLQQHKEKTSAGTAAHIQSSDTQPVQKEKEALSQDFWLTRGTKTIRRAKGKVARRSSDTGGVSKINSELNGITLKNETTRASAYSPVTLLYVQGKSSSMSGCLNCFSTPLIKEGQLNEFRSPKGLPRSSSVISTAEGSSRRSSVSSDCRGTVKTDPYRVSEENGAQEEPPDLSQERDSKSSEPELVPPAKPPRDPAVVLTRRHKSPVQESLLGSMFTFNSVFSNTIFSDSEVATTTSLDVLDVGQTVLAPNPSRVQSSLVDSEESAEKTPQTLLTSENEQSQTEEHAAGFTGKTPTVA